MDQMTEDRGGPIRPHPRPTAIGRWASVAALWLLVLTLAATFAPAPDGDLAPRGWAGPFASRLVLGDSGYGCGRAPRVAERQVPSSERGDERSLRTPASTPAPPDTTPTAAVDVTMAFVSADPASDRRPIEGVDVSHWNGIVPFDRVHASGRRFAFMKATQGTSFVDDTFARQFANARAAGVLAGGYHFYDYRVGGAAQAEHFLEVLAAAGALQDSLPPVVDLECFGPFGSAYQPRVRKQLRAFVDTVQARIGRRPIIYTSAHMWDQLTGGDRTFGANPLWVACWGCTTPRLPAGWDRWHFWQTGAVRIPGMDAKIGEDRFVGDAEALSGMTGRAFVVRGGGDITSGRDVRLRFEGLEADAVRVSVDARPWSRWRPWRGSVRVRLPDADGRHEVRVQSRTQGAGRGPVFRHSIRLDRQAPTITGLRPVFALGPIDRDRGRSRLEARVSVTGLGRTGVVEVTAYCAEDAIGVPVGGAARVRSTSGKRGTDRDAGSIPLDQACRLVAVATDRAGNTAVRHRAQTIQISERPADPSAELTYQGTWEPRVSPTDRSSVAWTSDVPGSTVSLRFRGIGVALIARRGLHAGSIAVRLDGEELDRVELRDATASGSRVVLSLPIGGASAAEHRLEIRVLDTAGPARSVVDIESFLILGTSSP